MFSPDQLKEKKRLSTPFICTVKKADFYIYVFPAPTQQTPKDAEDLEIAHAGL